MSKSHVKTVEICAELRPVQMFLFFIFYVTFLAPRPEELCVLTKGQIFLSQKTKDLESL